MATKPYQSLRLPFAHEGQPFDYAPFLRSAARTEFPVHTTNLGAVFLGDCLEVLATFADEVADCVFADPPFNLGKEYGPTCQDRRENGEYVQWCRLWLREAVRVLKPGGALFLYNLPKWNILLGAFLGEELGLEFRHWIAVEMSACLPIQGRLHPSHYSLLYYTKGKPKTFRRIRTPVAVCRHCGKEIKDYGGHRGALNPKGLTLKDVWSDIPPVRHQKFKSGNRKANALSTKLLDRVVEMSTVPGDLVLDPFGGAGTTYAVCEEKHRRWLGVEIEPAFYEDIIERLSGGHIRHHKNTDYVEDQ